MLVDTHCHIFKEYYQDIDEVIARAYDNGLGMIIVNGYDKKILIHDTHLEEDTASLDHYNAYSLIDYNRCGVPLLETVTEPCINSADEAIAFLEALRSVFLYCDTS